MPGRTGRPHKPTHLKLIAGDKNTSRHNPAEANPEALIPEPPPELSVDAREEWDRISVRLHTAGLLTVIDRTTLAAYCQAYGRWIQAEQVLAEMAADDPITRGLMVKTTNGNAIPNPVLGTANKAMSDMVRYAVEFGMSPSSRSRVRANLEKQEDDEERFFGN